MQKSFYWGNSRLNVAFFDRDGTIIKDYPDKIWSSIHEPEFIVGAIETLAYVQQQGYQIIVVTNQYLINEGYITLAQYESVNDIMIKTLQQNGVHVLDVFYCPHRRDEGCSCIKPNPGMIIQAMRKYPSIDIAKSFVVGDSIVDMKLAINLEMRGFWINGSPFDNSKLITPLSCVSELKEYISVFRKSKMNRNAVDFYTRSENTENYDDFTPESDRD